MIKKIGIIILLVSIIIPAGVFAAGNHDGGSSYGISEQRSGSYLQAVPLTDEEKYWLAYMREEEKLARDVYLYQNTIWNMRIFSNIAPAEQRHMDAIKILLDRYGIPDPAANNGQGKFSNPNLQILYDTLIQQGSVSRVEALNVGVIVEETDIADLKRGIAATRHTDIKNVFSNLLQGSQNHLDAFEYNLGK